MKRAAGWLAVAAVLFARQASDVPIAVRTAMTGQVLELVRAKGLYFVRLGRYPAQRPCNSSAGNAARGCIRGRKF